VPLLHIDDRLAGLAAAAAASAACPRVVRAGHVRRLEVSDDALLAADRALELAGAVIEAFAAGAGDRLGELCAPSVHVRTPSSDTSGLAALVDWATDGEGFSEVDVDVTSLVVAGASLAAEWCVHARHTGPLGVGWAVVEPTGQPVVVEGAMAGHLTLVPRGGIDTVVLDDLHLHYDTTGLLLQLAFA
jgi:hypothetical protein